MLDGQLVVMDEAWLIGFLELPTRDPTDQLTGRVEQAVRDGYRGVRLTGLYPAVGIAPHELALDRLVRAVPLTVLCPYFREDLTGPEVEQIRAVHGSEVTDTALYDDGSLRITHPRVGWVRVAGKVGCQQPRRRLERADRRRRRRSGTRGWPRFGPRAGRCA